MNHRMWAAGFAITLLCALPVEAQVSCAGQDSDTCQGTHTSVVAVAHDFQNPQTHVLYRVTVPQWSPDTRWGDGTNGFFYHVTGSGAEDLGSYVPLAGFAADPSGPTLPTFSFLVSSDTTTLTVAACASNYVGVSGGDPTCSEQFWAETFSSLPAPGIFSNAPVDTSAASVSLPSTGGAVANNGLFALQVEVTIPGGPFDADQEQWVRDHLVFFVDDGSTSSGTAYTNDIADQGVAVLSFEDATYQGADGKYYTRYGSTSGLDPVDFPKLLYFVYTTASPASGTTLVGVQTIYDQSTECTAKIGGNNSSNPDCAFQSTPPITISPSAALSPAGVAPTASTSANNVLAGYSENRQIDFLLSNTGALDCSMVVNPLASFTNPPNYQIGNVGAAAAEGFPNGLYYVLDTGFGNCTGSSDYSPLCERNPSAAGYVPHYLGSAGGGGLNGGGTNASAVTSAVVADEYQLASLLSSTQNSLIYFDNCGYWHTYTETNLSNRLSLPTSGVPGNKMPVAYSIDNELGRSVVVAKECCSSWYQKNQNQSSPSYQTPEPPQVLDDGFGMLLPAGSTATYSSLFTGESMVVYDAGSGTELFKYIVEPGTASRMRLYRCSDGVSATFDGSTLGLGRSGDGAQSCTFGAACPFLMSTGSANGLVTCTATDSTFVADAADWAAEVVAPSGLPIILEAWGGTGGGGESVSDNNAYKDGGIGGYAQTVLEATELPPLLVYMGKAATKGNYGASSTVVTSVPLSSFTTDLSQVKSPADVSALLVAGGGGAGNDNHKGGQGAQAIATTGGASSTAGHDGGGGDGGTGGNQDSEGSGSSHGGNSGIGGQGGGGVGWDESGGLIAPTSWSAGKGGQPSSSGEDPSGGGGGFGGGGGAKDSDAGAGGAGGGSWAQKAGATDSLAPTSAPSSPGAVAGAFRLSYTSGLSGCGGAKVTPRSGGDARFVVQCTFSTSVEGLYLSEIVDGIVDPDSAVDLSELPVYVEAFGGAGGDSDSGNHGGRGGYASSGWTLGELEALSSTLDVYVGDGGGKHNCGAANCGPHGGGGGASTIVSVTRLDQVESPETVTDPSSAGFLLIAAGGGGAGSSIGGGGRGGVANASDESDASCGGFQGQWNRAITTDPIGGFGGNGGGGGCDGDRTGAGGEGGSGGLLTVLGKPGKAQVGGWGGKGGQNGHVWLSNPVSSWQAGDGGAAHSQAAGGGGGGFGGGGSGARNFPFAAGGGGGGGSWARQASLPMSDAPLAGSSQAPNPAGAGAVILTFDICVVDPLYPGCAGEAVAPPAATNVQATIRVDRLGRITNAILHGSAAVDVGEIDVGRVSHAATGLRAIRADAGRRDRDGDGYLDRRFYFGGQERVGGPQGRHCLRAYLLDGTLVLGCDGGEYLDPVRPETATLDHAALRARGSGSTRITVRGTLPRAVDVAEGVELQVTDGAGTDATVVVPAEACEEATGSQAVRCVMADATVVFRPTSDELGVRFEASLSDFPVATPHAGPVSILISTAAGTYDARISDCDASAKVLRCR